DRGAPSGVFDVVAAAGAQQIICEGAQAGDDVGVLADARRVLGESNIAQLVATVFDAPMASDPFVPAFRRRTGGRGHPEDDLGRLLAKTRRGIAPANRALQPQHGFYEPLPRRMAEPRFGGEDCQLARLPAIAALGLAFRIAARLAARGTELEPASQAGLIVLGDHAFEQFFWQCSASSVNRQPFSPSASISSGAVGISLLFSATITCASTILSAWRSADIICTALRSLKASKLPRSVLPSTAMAVSPSAAGGVGRLTAWRRNADSNASASTPCRMSRSPV